MKSVHSACLFMLLVCALGRAQNPIPLLIQPLVPASVAPGSGAFTLTVNGAGFTSNATVYWKGSLRSTTVVSPSTVQAKITAADVARAGVAWVTVGNLGTGEVQSNVVYFPIRTSAKGLGFLPRSVQNVTTRDKSLWETSTTTACWISRWQRHDDSGFSGKRKRNIPAADCDQSSGTV